MSGAVAQSQCGIAIIGYAAQREGLTCRRSDGGENRAGKVHVAVQREIGDAGAERDRMVAAQRQRAADADRELALSGFTRLISVQVGSAPRAAVTAPVRVASNCAQVWPQVWPCQSTPIGLKAYIMHSIRRRPVISFTSSKHRALRGIAGGWLSLCLWGIPESAPAQTATTFTYQGELRQSGTPPNGPHAMAFSLWTALTSGVQVGSTINVAAVPVSNGMFTVQLDFGAGAFNHDARWLAISVNGTALTPRQAITRAPYAIAAGTVANVPSAAVVGTYAGVTGVGTLNSLHVAGTNATLRLEDTTTPGGYSLFYDAQPTQLRVSKHNSAGQVLMDFNPKPDDGTSAARVRFFRETDTSGPKSVDFLRGNFTTGTSASIGVDGANSFFQIHGGNVGIGTDNPSARLAVTGNGSSTVMRVSNGGGGAQSNIGLIIGDVVGTGQALSLYGVTANDLLRVQNDGAGRAALFAGQVKFASGNVAIGTADPAVKLHVTGGSDTAPTGGGFVVLGNTNGANLSLDNNEIMARNNGDVSTLFLNANGGAIAMGQSGIRPAFAYGLVRSSDGALLNSSPNVIGATHLGGGLFRVQINGGFNHAVDMAQVTSLAVNGIAQATYYSDNGDLMVRSVDLDDWILKRIDDVFFTPVARNFSFVIYKH